MTVDVLGLFNNASNVVISAILILGIYRALQMRGAFVNQAYRSRATWSVFLMLIILILFASFYATIPSFGILAVIGVLPFLATLLTFFAYADRSVLVAMETDFFHRNTLAWVRLRKPAYLIFMACIVVVIISAVFISTTAEQTPLLADIGTFTIGVVIPGLLAYSAAALIVGAKRSSDRTLRRSILLFGLALATLVLNLVLTNPLTQGTLPFVVVNDGTALVGIYLIYRSVMSLSPLGRVEKNAAQTSQAGGSSALPQRNSRGIKSSRRVFRLRLLSPISIRLDGDKKGPNAGYGTRWGAYVD